jgi:hypothetical protein
LALEEVVVIKRHPYRGIVTVVAVMAVAFFMAGMIGQYNDGPWGGLPEWLGALSWFTFLFSIPVLLLLLVYLAFTAVRQRLTAG